VAATLPVLAERATVIHVTGDAAHAEALAARRALPDAIRERYRPSPFLEADDMLAALVAADLVIGRAGSSTLAEVTAVGRPMIVVPYPHAAGHQRANAAVLADAGAARLVEDAVFDGSALLAATDLLDEPTALAGMAAAARALGRPAAADAVADLVIAAALRGPLPDAEAVDRRSRGLA
jgi:UDP-N-acetylglucosamine--N-acetylmuramyl-(pentapeptide) pyrophosphoryl-undecaprenol N-acetylglucosamine transferase